MAKPKLIFISLENWDDIWRRNQFLAVRMQQDLDVTFIGPELPFWKIFKSKPGHYQKIKIKYIYKFFPEKYLPWLNKLFYKIQTVGSKADILWINDHNKYFMESPKIIYDITDDWTLLDPKIKQIDELLCQKADKIIVCSENLLRSRKKFKNKLSLIKNGVDLKPLHSRDIPGKYFLYTGSLHEERLDIPLVISLATHFPQERFVFIGPVFFSPKIRIELAKHKNIELWGAKPYPELAKYMNEAKALLVPHLTTNFVNSLDPIKQYEYMLSDKPVIATNISGFKDLQEIFCIAKNRAEFIKTTGLVIKNKLKVTKELRQKKAKENSWDERYKQVKKIIFS